MLSLESFLVKLWFFFERLINFTYEYSAQVSNFYILILFLLLLTSTFNLFSTVRYYVRFFLLLLNIAITAIISIPLCIICSLLGYGGNSHYFSGRICSFLCRLLLNQRHYILDDEVLRKLGDTPVIFISNHQSSLDLSFLGTIFPKNCSIMAKKSLQFVPLLGLYLRLSSTFLIDRKNHGKALKTTSALAKSMKDNNLSVFIYPEGTRSGLEGPTLLPFKKGAFHLSLETGFSIVPIVFSNTSHLFSPKYRRFESGGMGIKGNLHGLNDWTKSSVLSPISPQGRTKENIQAFVDEAHSLMSQCLAEISKIDYNNF